MMGGVTCPPQEALASTAPAKRGLKPTFFISGMVMTPVVTVLAMGEPEIIPNRPEDTTLTAAMTVMRSGNVADAIAGAEGFIAPSQMLTLVDAEGIGMKMIGAVPRRDAAHQTQGRMPAPGWIAQNRWQGRMPYASNPVFENPRGGILGNTNNKIVERPFPNHLSFEWGDSQRVFRWQRLMQMREVHTRDSFIEAQLDTVSFTARSLLPLVGADLWFTG